MEATILQQLSRRLPHSIFRYNAEAIGDARHDRTRRGRDRRRTSGLLQAATGYKTAEIDRRTSQALDQLLG
jgi:hypothetical protein